RGAVAIVGTIGVISLRMFDEIRPGRRCDKRNLVAVLRRRVADPRRIFRIELEQLRRFGARGGRELAPRDRRDFHMTEAVPRPRRRVREGESGKRDGRDGFHAMPFSVEADRTSGAARPASKSLKSSLTL